MHDGKPVVLPLVLPIIREEAKRNGYTVEQLLSSDMQRHLTSVRHYAMWRARKETGRSWESIARHFKRDHTTIMHGYRKVEALPEELRGVFPARVVKVPRNAHPDWGKTYQSKPCYRGHDGTRYVSNGRCVWCKRFWDVRRNRSKQFYAEAAE